MQATSSCSSLDTCISYFSYSFASRALHIKNKPHVNEVLSDAALLKRYARQITKLQTELEVSIIYLIAHNVYWELSVLH
jgi:beta-N-acetylglucosaminidase